MKPHKSFFAAFGYAGRGVWHTLARQRNFRVHVSAALLVVALSWLLQITPTKWALVVLAMGLVLALELVNTAIEALVDLASPGYPRLAAEAKDAAAGAVLVAAGASAVLALIVYLPGLWHIGREFMVRWHQRPIAVVGLFVGLAVSYALLWGVAPERHQSKGGQNRIGTHHE